MGKNKENEINHRNIVWQQIPDINYSSLVIMRNRKLMPNPGIEEEEEEEDYEEEIMNNNAIINIATLQIREIFNPIFEYETVVLKVRVLYAKICCHYSSY